MSSAGERVGDDDLNAVELVAVARVAKARGVRGEVAADLLTDFPERFDGLRELIAVFPGESGSRSKANGFTATESF
jgi:ribosomal 30S subunit maturation factor RimM